ncbi:MAG: 4-(cytidine 5'-diphospho)-2-C-methyl-D-erythritol kinase [Candidatus Eremiobacterota bacterium]
MFSLSEKAFAKINLYLEIIKKRSDGYHEIRTIFQTISLADELILEKTDEGIIINCSDSTVPCNENNLIYKAAKLIKEISGYNKGINIILKKNIPVAAGLGGGSSDGAATIRGLNKLLGLNLTYSEMLQVAAAIGSDVPFLVEGGTVLAEGRGEKLIKSLRTPDLWVIVIKPDISVSTGWAYKQWNPGMKKCINLEDFISNIDSLTDKNLLFNSFEDIIEKHYPVIKTIKEKLDIIGATEHLLSGSGSSVFALTKKFEIAKKIKEEFKESCFITKTVGRY